MKKNDIIPLEITAVSSEGAGIGRYEGMAIFVNGAAEGDRLQVRILKVKKTYAYGKIEEIVAPSEHRTAPDCPTFSSCGGCVYRHITYKKECEIKEKKVEDCIRRIGGIDLSPRPIIAAERICGYRNKAQLPISQNGRVGFFAPHSHRIIETEACALTPPVYADIARVFERFLAEYKIPMYHEATHSGLVRHLYIRSSCGEKEIMVTAVINGDSLPHSEELKNALLALLGERLVSLQININKKDTNVILGEECRTIFGKDFITDTLCGVKIRISPLSFYQVNREMTEKLYKKAAEYLEPDGKNIIDLYCGAGTIGLSMADKAESIIGVEIVPEAVADAKINAKNAGVDNAEFICADAAAAAEILARRALHPDAVILDPPRKGCDEKLLNTVATAFAANKIVYISCDPATLARDAAVLTRLGYKLTEYTPVDLFPRTSHVECVALFVRNTSI